MDLVTAVKIWIMNKWNFSAAFGFSYSFLSGILNGENIQLFVSIVGGALFMGIGVWGKFRKEKRQQEEHDLKLKLMQESHEAKLDKN